MVYPQMKKDCQSLTSSYNCYKLLGFDIMLDENLTPWVLEVSFINKFSSTVQSTLLDDIVHLRSGQITMQWLLFLR